MKKGMKALERVATAGLTLTLAGCEVSEASPQGTAGQRQDARAETAGGDAGIADLSTLRVTMMPFITGPPVEYIRKNKLDGRTGFKVDTIMLATGTSMNEALAAGLWDVGAMGAATVTGVVNCDMIIIGKVLEPTNGLGVFAKPSSPVAQVKGYNPSYSDVLGGPETIKGTTILLPIGTVQYFTTSEQLEKLELGITDVSIVNMDTARAYQAFQANQRGATTLNAPALFETVDGGMVRVGNLVDLGTRHVDMVMANRKAMEGKQELAQRHVDCVEEACKAFNNDPNMAADLMVDFLKDAGTEASRESCVSDLGRVRFIAVEDWKDREVDNFARESGKLCISLGQLGPGLIDKFNGNIVSDFMKNGNWPGRTGR